ncbi:hypothetical protein M9H77_29827 [Catharanthus roseus]|uniref:Uncharacterized protein n=1 Tax=Catharanthus roseus TaxID=4058 RepID=A0ACB9ZXE0_CATRO|nr:hypothetical protein M9H77_29827 [Catharanthus roseus]
MGGMEIIPAPFHDIGWGSLLIVNESFYPMMLYEFYANLQRDQFFGPNDHIGISKIYNQNTFKRMGFSRNEDVRLIRGSQEEDCDSKEEEEDEGNEPENMDEDETNEEEIQREMRQNEGEKIKPLKTLKTCVLVRDVLRYFL